MLLSAANGSGIVGTSAANLYQAASPHGTTESPSCHQNQSYGPRSAHAARAFRDTLRLLNATRLKSIVVLSYNFKTFSIVLTDGEPDSGMRNASFFPGSGSVYSGFSSCSGAGSNASSLCTAESGNFLRRVHIATMGEGSPTTSATLSLP